MDYLFNDRFNLLFGGANYFYMIYFVAIGVSILWSLLLYGFFIYHAIIGHEKKTWVEDLLKRENFSDETKDKLLASVSSSYQLPIYKGFKFYLLHSFIVFFVIGLLILMNKRVIDLDSKILVFVPLIVAAITFGASKFIAKNSGLMREITASILFLGVAFTFFTFSPVYDIDFMRTDIKVFLILLFGLFIIAKFKSTAVSFLYMIMVVIGTGLITNDYNANESFEFLRLLMWPFAFAILFFWRHRFDEKERVDSFEVFFGTLFLVMILSLAISLSYGMAIISFIVFVPALYMFSKVTYSNSVWYLERPIESLLTIVTIILSILFSYEDSFRIIEEIRYGLSNIGFMKICTLIVFLIAGIYAYFTYREYEEQNKGTINWFILAFPLVIIVANLLGKDSYGHYLMIAYSLALGVYYFFKGLQSKNELKVILGFISASIVVHLTVYKFIGKYMHHDIVIGTYLLSWSLVFLTAVVIMRRIWKVSNEEVKVIE